eukprot:TRINITY_DN35550_c0_g1_i1.p1 TRINITY_DN35550_c0_g1~~TRINITY_DN35550_c0_g1_i1.p1  ORF type:complete len:254 (+),score=62.77 TRINITY_DN35550_c0_g1_i1:95-763(+)
MATEGPQQALLLERCNTVATTEQCEWMSAAAAALNPTDLRNAAHERAGALHDDWRAAGRERADVEASERKVLGAVQEASTIEARKRRLTRTWEMVNFPVRGDYEYIGPLATPNGTKGGVHYAEEGGNFLFRLTHVGETECGWIKHEDEHFWQCPSVYTRLPADGQTGEYTLKVTRSRQPVRYDPQWSPQKQDFGAFHVPKMVLGVIQCLGAPLTRWLDVLTQ